eukprot:scaffold388310_cov51-Attheya_sp.AAC.1
MVNFSWTQKEEPMISTTKFYPLTSKLGSMATSPKPLMPHTLCYHPILPTGRPRSRITSTSQAPYP